VLGLGVVPLFNGKEDYLFNCDRQCRWYLGFFERDIQGARNGSDLCSCTRIDPAAPASYLGQVPYYTVDHAFLGPPTVPSTPFSSTACCVEGDHTPLANCTPTGACHGNLYPYAKPFNSDTWADDYTTGWVCLLKSGATVPQNIQEPPEVHAACMNDGDEDLWTCLAWKQALESRGDRILHCGQCSSCSSLQDLSVLESTKTSITSDMTACSTAFVLSQKLPFGKQSLVDLKACLVGRGIGFSDDGRAWQDPRNRPTCMDTWVDNILSDASLCVRFCWAKFLHTANTGDFARDQCLQCDEYTSGPAFIRGAGANRRSTGITSDIDRTQLRGTPWQQKICKVGFFS